MANDEHDAIEQTGDVNRRDVLVGGAAAAAMTALPNFAAAVPLSPDKRYPRGAIYMNPDYNKTFKNAYSRDNIASVHNTICGNTVKYPTEMLCSGVPINRTW